MINKSNLCCTSRFLGSLELYFRHKLHSRQLENFLLKEIFPSLSGSNCAKQLSVHLDDIELDAYSSYSSNVYHDVYSYCFVHLDQSVSV